MSFEALAMLLGGLAGATAPRQAVDPSGTYTGPGVRVAGEKLVIFEWPGGTRMVRYLTPSAIDAAKNVVHGRRSTSRISGNEDVWLGFEDLTFEREVKHKQTPPYRMHYMPRALLQVDVTHPEKLTLWAVMIRPDIYLRKELLDAVRWVLIEELDIDEMQVRPEPHWKSLNEEMRWALHLPVVVKDEELDLVRNGEETSTLDNLLGQWVEAMRPLDKFDDAYPDPGQDRRLRLKRQKLVRTANALKVSIDTWSDRLIARITDVAGGKPKNEHPKNYIKLPAALIEVDLKIRDFDDAGIHIWKIVTDNQASVSITDEALALYDPNHPLTEANGLDAYWSPRAGEAVPLASIIYQDGDLLDFLEHRGIILPASRYAAWLDQNVAEMSVSHVENDDIFWALGVTPLWLRSRADIVALLQASLT